MDRRAALRYAVAFAIGSLVTGIGGLASYKLTRPEAPVAESVRELQEVQIRAPITGRSHAAGNVTAQDGELLPDLDQEAPAELLVLDAGDDDIRLAFDSAVANVGAGPLVLVGTRKTSDDPAMNAEQLVSRSEGSRAYPNAGRLAYVRSPDHAHWHLVPFMRYELRRAGDFTLAAKDRKSGFCLGDRYETALPVSGRARSAAAKYTSRCGLNEPGLLELEQGISVGHGDDYRANLEGQYLDITDVEAGEYLLVHRVNDGGRLRESDYTNNAASVLLEVSRPNGRPHVKVLSVCPDSERCPRD